MQAKGLGGDTIGFSFYATALYVHRRRSLKLWNNYKVSRQSVPDVTLCKTLKFHPRSNTVVQTQSPLLETDSVSDIAWCGYCGWSE